MPIKNIQKRREYCRKWQQKWRKKNPDKWKKIYQKSWKKNYEKNKPKHNAYLRKYTQELRLRIIKKYGEKCECCGEPNQAFLSIDHINNNGTIHRKKFSRSSREVYRDIIRNPKEGEYRILCFNCNMGRQFNGNKEKICPHKLKKEF